MSDARVSGEGQRVDRSTESATDGSFSLGLPPGTYDRVSLSHALYWSVDLPGFSVFETSSAGHEVVLGKGASLTIEVVDDRGAALDAAEVALLRRACRGYTDPSGSITFRGAQSGIVDVKVWKRGFVSTEAKILIADEPDTRGCIVLPRR